MKVPRFLRLDGLEPREMTEEELRPLLKGVAEDYYKAHFEEYQGAILTPEEGIELSLREHHHLLINGDYLFAYEVGREWYAKQSTLVELFIKRVGPGKTTLREVFDAIRVLTLLHGARETQLSPRAHPALHRLYERNGAEDVMTIMRIK